MFKQLLLAVLPLALIIAVPLMLRKPGEALDLNADQLVIVSPHNESIRFEFEQAFRKHYQEKTGRKVMIDWRATGGTSEIVRYVGSAFTSQFKQYWTKERKQEWSDEVAAAFMDRRKKPEDHPARKAFLESNLGIGIDLMFGGGSYDFNKQASLGTLVPCGFRERHPELFEGKKPILVQSLGGELWYDKQDRFYGACFSSFGICVNLDRLEKLGYDVTSASPLHYWRDLGDTRLLGGIGLADPTMSGSINKCFEMLVQREMQDIYTALQPRLQDGSLTERDVLDQGWESAMTLIKRAGGNARYLTFSAGKVPVDCATGQIACGMCIDFYGRSQSEWEERHIGRKTMLYLTPEVGSSVSCDPIGMFRGAPHPELAKMFIDFVMSKEGQALWNRKVGVPGGPQKYCLNRLSVRRDLYTPEERALMVSPEAAPFELAGAFTYQAAWTAAYFDLLRNLIRVMLIDCAPELRAAWTAIVKAGGPDACPQAMAEFRKLPFAHHEAPEAAKRLQTPESQTIAIREWADFFRNTYQNARALAK